MTDERAVTLADLDARLREVEALQEMMLRIMAATKPLANVLEHYGATQTQERAFYALLDDLARRCKGRADDHPTFAYFQMKLCEVFPSLRNDREFLELVIDTLKVERAAYRDLHAYMATNRWGQ
jgi:hypothetical protein